MKDTLAVIAQRKSVRHYTRISVANEQIDVLLRAAMAAPSSKNLQGWEFIVLTDREKLDYIGERVATSRMLLTAPVAIVVCGNVTKYSGESQMNWVVDCAAATENLLLAAESMGLGAVWTAAYPYADRMAVVRAATGIPIEIMPLCVIPLGYPAKDEPVKDKWHPEKIHYNQW